MNTDIYKNCRQDQSPQIQSSKYSLRMKTKISSNTDSSTTCLSDSHHSKISIKLINNKAQQLVSTKSLHSAYYLNIKYDDIRSTKKVEQPTFLAKLFCGQLSKNKGMGCDCLIKCIWIDKWMTEVPQNALNINFNKSQYRSIDAGTLSQIEKDLKRTQPNNPTFENQIYLERLEQTLLHYCLADKEVGYMQGMNIVASVFVFHSKCSFQSNKSFEMLMRKCNLREIYINDLKAAKKHCSFIIKLLKNKAHDLYQFLVKENEIELQLFIIGWLFSMLGSFVPLQKMHLIIDAFIERGWLAIYSIIFTLLVYLRNEIISADEQTDIMKILSIQYLKESQINWEQLIYSAQSVPISNEEVY